MPRGDSEASSSGAYIWVIAEETPGAASLAPAGHRDPRHLFGRRSDPTPGRGHSREGAANPHTPDRWTGQCNVCGGRLPCPGAQKGSKCHFCVLGGCPHPGICLSGVQALETPPPPPELVSRVWPWDASPGRCSTGPPLLGSDPSPSGAELRTLLEQRGNTPTPPSPHPPPPATPPPCWELSPPSPDSPSSPLCFGNKSQEVLRTLI